MASFPNFYGHQFKNSSNFLDDLEVALLVLGWQGKDGDDVRLKIFLLLLKEEAKVWYQGLEIAQRSTWEAVRANFLRRYSEGDNLEELWQKLSMLQQSSLEAYLGYEATFLKMWAQWIASLLERELAPNFWQKDNSMVGIFPLLQGKEKSKFPESFEEALHWARVKD